MSFGECLMIAIVALCVLGPERFLSSDYSLGKLFQKATQLNTEIKTKLVFDLIDFIIESRFWGYSLIQLGDIKDDGGGVGMDILPLIKSFD